MKVRRADALALAGVVALSAWYAFGVVLRSAGRSGHSPSIDTYGYSVPNFLYARRALAQGHGLLWNELQNCGQPLFGMVSTAFLYPLNALLVALPSTETALLLLVLANLSIAGAGAYFLARELELGRSAALCCAASFQLGGSASEIASWMPAVQLASYAWLPVALFGCERALRRPGPGPTVGLGLALTLQLLAGFPQISFFTYQAIALRGLFELLRRRRAALRPLAWLAPALALPPLLGAVQLQPALEVVGESLRDRSLSDRELHDSTGPSASTFSHFRELVGVRLNGPGNTFSAVGVALAGFALLAARSRALFGFYAFATALSLGLAYWPPLIELYRDLPLGRTFRSAPRFLWLASLGLAVWIGFGVDALARREGLRRAGGAGALAFALAAALAFRWLSPTGLRGFEWGLVAGVLALGAAVVLAPRARTLARGGLPLLLGANLLAVSGHVFLTNLPELAPLYSQRAAYAVVEERATPQDRLYAFGPRLDLASMPKSASLFGLASISDYEPQTSRRYAELFVRMVRGAPLVAIHQHEAAMASPPRSRGLLNLVAARYLIETGAPSAGRPPFRDLRPIWEGGGARVWENLQALPRAFYVPQARVVVDDGDRLKRLARPSHRPRQLALLDATPADGFLGRPGRARGRVSIEESRSERLALRVSAPREGFVFVSDQHYPGWQARVNDAPTPILRANHAFRLVRVPRGGSRVVFRYRPASLRRGALLSGATALGLLAWGWRRRRARRAT